MSRIIAAGVILFTLFGCEQKPEQPVTQAGVFTTVGGPRTWRLEAPPPDTIRTVTRRVWYGPDADSRGSISRDGTEIIDCNEGTGDLEVRDLTTGTVMNLTNNPAPYSPGFCLFPVISSDEQRVAYSWLEMERPNRWQLRVVDRETLEQRVLQTVEPAILPFDWSPDHEQILGLIMLPDGTNQIVLISSGEGTVQVLKQLDWRLPMNMAFSPDGRSILYDFPTDPESEESRDLFLLPLDGGRETHLVDHPANDMLLGWAPEGGYILFSSDRTGTPAAWLQRVVDGAAAGSPLLVKPDLWQASPIGFTKDGRFFYGIVSGSRTMRVAGFNPESGEVVGPPLPGAVRSVGNSSSPSWSPDGKYLAFLLQTPTSQVPRILAIRSMDNGEERHRRLPSDLYIPTQALWTPDGRTILLRSQDREGQDGLFRVDVVTGEIQPVFKRALWGIGPFDILPGGKAIAYATEGRDEADRAEGKIMLRNLESGAEREIYRGFLEGMMDELHHLALAPDGETLAVLRRKQLDGGRRDDAVLLLSIAGGEPRELLRGGALQNFTWSPNGEFLLIRTYDPPDGTGMRMHLSWVEVESGDVSEVGLSLKGPGDMALSPDGRFLAYIDGVPSSEVWVMENFLPVGEGG